MPRPRPAPDVDDGASAVVTDGVFRVGGGPPPTGTSGLLGARKLHLTVLRRDETLVSFAPGTVAPSSVTYDDEDETATIADTIQTTGTVGARSLAPRDLLELEAGRSIVVSSLEPPTLNRQRTTAEDAHGVAVLVAARRLAPIAQEDEQFFEERSKALRAALSGDSSPSNLMHGDELMVNSEVGIMGAAWRALLQRIMLFAYDEVNGLRLGRLLQLNLTYQTAFEAYITNNLIHALDSRDREFVRSALTLAFKNRNVSRLIVQGLAPRYDWGWHSYTMQTHNRFFDAMGQFPFSRFMAFPATENFPSTRNHALGAIFRLLLGPSNWVTRVVTRGREGLVTDNPDNVAQNLAAESNGFEVANRNQFGTGIGRIKTSQFRVAHRLPVDESLVRNFDVTPVGPMLNNGCWHVLRQQAKHWCNILDQPWGNFAHQRMEQLDPFETLRFHMPIVLTILSSLRGRNAWDATRMAPFYKRLQNLRPEHDTETARKLIKALKTDIVMPVCGGIPSLMEPFHTWLDAMDRACQLVEKEAIAVFQMVTTVELGIRLGYDIMSKVNWKVPSDADLKDAIKEHILDVVGKPRPDIPSQRIASALLLTTPRDKRTLIELFQKGYGNTKPAQLLLGRVKTLLQRELRRHRLNNAIREASVGGPLQGDLVRDDWYWLEEVGSEGAVYIYAGVRRSRKGEHVFIHVNSGYERVLQLSAANVRIFTYVPVAEAISRAKRVLMNIEIEHGRKIRYSAFMELSFLRLQLKRLLVVSSMNCEVLDDARLNVLREVQRSNQVRVKPEEMEVGKTYYEYDRQTNNYIPFNCEKQCHQGDPTWRKLHAKKIVKVPPQSVLVVGGGPAGLITVIHCVENVLATGGVVKLYEARDAFIKGGATFERAQIVRLDARWIEMMRYHLGSIYEDVYIPASGETDAQLGNTLPSQGFVEITIKDLENMLHIEISRLWSKGIISVFSDSKSNYDHETNSLTKLGANLKKGDFIVRNVDPDGLTSTTSYSWKVAELKLTKTLRQEVLSLGQEYGIFLRSEASVVPFKLTGINIDSNIYSFRCLQEGVDNLECHASSLPSIYPSGTKAHSDVETVVLESVMPGSAGGYTQDEVSMEVIRKMKFTIDIGHTHVVESIGKPHGSKVHVAITTDEPHGTCCIQGLKVSMGMHNFGEKRWGDSILDDIRSVNDQNTRIIGDFTKMVRVRPIVERMYKNMSTDENWQTHFNTLVARSAFPELSYGDHIVNTLIRACLELTQLAPSFRRQTLQTRFFETGDNYYLGMEFNREYDEWRKKLGEKLVAPLRMSNNEAGVVRLKEVLKHHIDRLWYDGCLETIRTGDVYNSGARKRVPRLYLINSHIEEPLANIDVGESFRLSANPKEKYEVVVKTGKEIVVRNVEGFLSRMNSNTAVKLEGNLSRGPDGNAESAVALTTFPVAHYVNYRTARVLDKEKGYLIAFIGDEQATPHFMRYSGLTGACINATSVNQFVKKALDGVSFVDRFRAYSEETNWSNGEVVQRGTTSNYGVDGFLRPGLPYRKLVEYLYNKVIEYEESGQDLDEILSHDWKVKIAAALIPRGLETNPDFCTALRIQFRQALFDSFIEKVSTNAAGMESAYRELRRRTDMRGSMDWYWNEATQKLDSEGSTEKSQAIVSDIFAFSRVDVVLEQLIAFAVTAFLNNKRISSEGFNQPKSVDSVVDDFAVEAQNFANSLTMSAALAAAAVAFSLAPSDTAFEDFLVVVAAISAASNINTAFSTMTDVSRYKIRNEEARVIFWNEKFEAVKRTAFSLMNRDVQGSIARSDNPFVAGLERAVTRFRQDLKYYGYDPAEFDARFSDLQKNLRDPFAVNAFRLSVVTEYMADTYHVNSYVQESLMGVVKALDQLHHCLVDLNPSQTEREANSLFLRLVAFEPRLKDSLQDGPVRWGFVKKRRFVHWDISVFVRYVYSLFWCASPWGANLGLAPIQVETLGIVKQTRRLTRLGDGKVLRRELRDLEALFWATRESDIASVILLSVFLGFVASILLTISNIFLLSGKRVAWLQTVSGWASLPSSFGALLALFHFVRKIFILLKLWAIIGRKFVRLHHEQESLQLIRGVTMIQIFLTVARMLAAGGSAVALPYALIVNQPGGAESNIPVWIALASVLVAIAAAICFFGVEYVVRYNLPVDLGPFVCGLFRDEIHTIYEDVKVRTSDTDTQFSQQRETWEYVARDFLHQYRFDAVFAADRYGSILQYLQNGMHHNLQNGMDHNFQNETREAQFESIS